MAANLQQSSSRILTSDSFTLKNDRYRRVRGGNATFLTLFCSKCESWLLLYQKDGDGKLLRCYLNRIFAPSELEALQHAPHIQEPKDLKPLSCRTCNALIGIPTRHHDGRLSFRLIPGSFVKKKGIK